MSLLRSENIKYVRHSKNHSRKRKVYYRHRLSARDFHHQRYLKVKEWLESTRVFRPGGLCVTKQAQFGLLPKKHHAEGKTLKQLDRKNHERSRRVNNPGDCCMRENGTIGKDLHSNAIRQNDNCVCPKSTTPFIAPYLRKKSVKSSRTTRQPNSVTKHVMHPDWELGVKGSETKVKTSTCPRPIDIVRSVTEEAVFRAAQAPLEVALETRAA